MSDLQPAPRTALVPTRDDERRHAQLNARARSSDQELHRAWRALTTTPTLQGDRVRAGIEATAVQVTRSSLRSLRDEARTLVRSTLHEHGVAIVAVAFAFGVWSAARNTPQRRSRRGAPPMRTSPGTPLSSSFATSALRSPITTAPTTERHPHHLDDAVEDRRERQPAPDPTMRPVGPASTPAAALPQVPDLEAIDRQVRDFVVEHPAVAVVGAVAAGFMVGRLLSRF